ncbi:hypothetical protein RCL1_006566 [Eukaryota sp. TZLM3-RCL]
MIVNQLGRQSIYITTFLVFLMSNTTPTQTLAASFSSISSMSDESSSDKLPRSNTTPALASSLSSSLSSITTMSDEPRSHKLPRSNTTPSKLTFVSEFFVRVILTDQQSCLLIPGVTIVMDRGLICSNETSEGRIKCCSLDSISTLDLKQRQDFFTDPLMLTLNLLCVSTKPFVLNSQLFRPLGENELKFLVLLSNSWKKDLTVDGDVEANPGPSNYECSALDESWLDDFTIDNYISSLVSTTPTVFYVEVNIVERTFFKELMGDFTWFTDVYNKPGDFVFLIPINDFYVFPTEARGAHWSLLVFERFKDIRNFYYMDSLYNADCLEAAQIIVSRLNLEQTNLTFQELECIQQPNGFDCGVYTCWYAFLVLQVYHSRHSVPILEIESACKNGPPDISTFREDLEKLDISMIHSKHLASQHERLSKFIRYVQRQGKSPHVLEHPRFEHVACRDLELTVDLGQWNIVDLLPLVPEPFPEPHSEVIDVVFPIDVNLEEHSPIPMSPVGDAIFPNVNPHVAKGVSKKPKTAKPPKSSTSSRTLSKKELKEKKFFKTRPLTRRVYTPNPDLEKKIKAEKAKKRSRQSDQNFEKKIRSSTLQIPVNDENKILYRQLYDSIPGKSSRQKRRMMNFHLVGRHFLEAETLLQQSLIDRETDVGHLNGRKTKDKETVFGPKIDIPTPKVNS